MFIEPPIVDAHAHIMTRRMPFHPEAWTRPDYEYSAEDYIADLDKHGVAFGVIAAASLYGDYNDYTLWALSAYKRLRATVVLDPSTSARELQALRDQGVVGVRMQWKLGAPPPDFGDFLHKSFINRLADCGVHVQLNASADQLAHVLPVLQEHGVAVVVDHFGLLRAPDGMEGEGYKATCRAIEKGRTWVKISAGFRLDPAVRQAGAADLLAKAGPGRLLWGSDAPYVGKETETSYQDTLDIFREIVPSAAQRRAISDAALRFYFF